MKLNKINLALLGTTLIVFSYNIKSSYAQSIFKENNPNQIQYLSQNNPESGSKQKRRWEGEGKLFESLNLTPEQKNQMKQIKDKYRPKMEAIRKNMRSEREILKNMMVNNEPTDKIRSQHQKVSILNKQANDLRFESMLEINKTLTPEQRKKLATMMDEKKPNRRPRGNGNRN